MWTHFIKCSEVLSNEWLSSAAQDWDSNPSGLPPASFFNFKLLHFVFLRDLHSCWIMEKWLQPPQNFVRYLSFQRNWWNSTVYREENTKVSLKCWKKITSGKLGWGRRCRWREAKTKLFVFVFRTSFFTPPQHRQLFWKLYFFFALGVFFPSIEISFYMHAFLATRGYASSTLPQGFLHNPWLGEFPCDISFMCVKGPRTGREGSRRGCWAEWQPTRSWRLF